LRRLDRINGKLAVLLIILLAGGLLSVHQPNVNAQSGSNTVNLSLTFHNYSLLLRDHNGSLCVYDGADGSTTSANPTQTSLVSETSGTQTVFGFTVEYWSAAIIWAIKLPRDLHVDGTVSIKAYITSDFPISGFMSGSGYGMGLVDIDENNNEVQEFVTQAPYTQGGNAFTSTPTQYSVTTNVDYTFKAGHSIGFAVGVGATSRGFSATVYFDSQAYNSGATLPVEDTSETHTFNADYNDATHSVSIVSNSAISNCQFDSSTRAIQFKAEGIKYTTGHCTVSIPKTLMQDPFTVTSGSTQITATLSEDSTNYQLDFTHTRNSNLIQITGADPTQPTATPTTITTAEPTTSPPIPEILPLTILLICIVTAMHALMLKKFSKKVRT
jgi:hypothetical protein